MSTPLSGYSSHFGINNIPFGVASSSSKPSPTCVTRFEDKVIFLCRLGSVFDSIRELPRGVFEQSFLNAYAALPTHIHQAVRQTLQELIRSDAVPHDAIELINAVSMHLPFQVGDFTDFSLSADHVQNASEAMTGVRSAPPSFYYQPVGYAGRCSSLDISGTPVERPLGQYWQGKPGQSAVVFGPCQKMDYELELGAFVGRPVPRRQRVPAMKANDHIFGYVLVNDWSARDIQGLEMSPLGPLNGKNAGTTVSPWVITQDAIAPFRTSSPPRQRDPIPYLVDSGNDALNVQLEVRVSNGGQNTNDEQIHCRSNVSWMYWTLSQCLAHQTTGGCGLRTGDLLATGTVSGSGPEEHGCLLEHMRIGETPRRGYLEDGETVKITGLCGPGVGFGECIAQLLPAKELVM